MHSDPTRSPTRRAAAVQVESPLPPAVLLETAPPERPPGRQPAEDFSGGGSLRLKIPGPTAGADAPGHVRGDWPGPRLGRLRVRPYAAAAAGMIMMPSRL
jgi:hypothetical protein